MMLNEERLPVRDAEREDAQTQEEPQEQRQDDGRKTGQDDVKDRAQQLADGMFRKRMKGITREEVLEYRKNKQAFAEYMEGRDGAAETREIAQREQMLDVRLCAMEAGVQKEFLDDAVTLALHYAGDGVTAQDAVLALLERNPAWGRKNLPEMGGNPAGLQDQKRKEPPKII